jgi:molybdopterin/thiamine biosynthesis adenylyltransferase
MNRLVTATVADLDTDKVVLGRRMIRSIAPDAQVRVVPKKLQSIEALDALKSVDVLFGCLDNDGARLVLNELAVAYGIPYFDLGVGIDAQNGVVRELGGRLAVVVPTAPACSAWARSIWLRPATSSPPLRNSGSRSNAATCAEWTFRHQR